MDRCQAEMGRGREKRRVEESRSEKRKSQKKEDADARKGRKVAKHCVFPMICGSGGSKSRLAKAAGAEPAGQMRGEKLHAVVARSTFASHQNVQNTPAPDHFWKLRCRKRARRCGAKHISKSKCTKHTMFGPLLEVAMSKKCTPLWREAHFEVKMYKAHHVRSTFGRSDVAGARDCAPCQQWAKREGFVAFPKAMAGVGHLKRIFKDAFRVAGAVQRTCSSEMLGGQGADFLMGLHFGASDLQVCWDDSAWQVQHFVWLGITFSWQAQYFRQVDWKNRKTHWYEAASSALNFPFLKEVSQNCFVFDVVKLKNWRSLAEVLRFWRC